MQYVLTTEKNDIPKTAMKKILVIISVVPVLWLFSNNAVNWHYHQLACGQIVQHAHPYSKSDCASEYKADSESDSGAIPAENHTHNRSELITLFMSSGIMLLTLSLLVLLIVAAECKSVSGCAIHLMIKVSTLYRIPLLRAPPVY